VIPIGPSRANERRGACSCGGARARGQACGALHARLWPVRGLNDAHRRLRDANDRLWSGLHPGGLAAAYGKHPAAVAVESRSEALEADDPLAAVQQVHWRIHRAHLDYQDATEQRRQLAVDVGELTPELVEVLIAARWTEDLARNANVLELARAQDER
jgi:hypothetical protein